MHSLLPLFWVWWQQVPAHLEPVAFMLGGIPVYWYALFFLFGSALVYWLAGREYRQLHVFTKSEYQDFPFGVFLSAVIGGKLGFLLLYWWPFVLSQQGAWLPITEGSRFGLPGMSFVGGLIGVALFIGWYAKRNQKSFFLLTDILALFIPIALFFGRLGSFVHNELWGRVTNVPWGMYFSNAVCPPQCEALGVVGETVLRHPSTLYQAFLEGIVLFSILFFLRKQNAHKEQNSGILTAWFCILYGLLRFLGEFFREPDVQIGYLGVFTINQLVAVAILVLGIGILKTIRKA